MTYVQTGSGSLRRRYGRRSRARHPHAMGGLFDFVEDAAIWVATKGGFSGGDVRDARHAGCMAEAESGTAVMGMQIDDLERTWQPTGFYTPDQMQTVIDTVLDYAGSARAQIEEALRHVDIRDSDHQASGAEFDRVYGEFSEQTGKAILFVRAMNEARAKGITAVNAPGLKFWVVSLMKASREVAKGAIYINCNKSVLERISAFLNSLVDRAIAIIKTVVGIVLKAGELALDVAGDLAGSMLKILKYAPYFLLLGGGLYLYKMYRDR